MSGATDDRPTLLEVLPKAGLVYSEKGNLGNRPILGVEL
jgi:hypothetical protein